ncbi:MAG: hypothetical protein KQA41_04710 [Candidatus Aenigmarchaeota archaeon]|nr:hypothetical protein [Candidatus Aenigmarchaeota archaeon]
MPIIILFGIFGWITIFLETWRHWPKLETKKRIEMSVSNATFLTLFLIISIYIFLQVMFQNI